MKFVALALFFIALPAHAALVVSEIMYNPPGSNAGHQWIEVTNTGTEAFDLGAKDIRLYDASGNHLIKPYIAGGSTVLSPGGVVVIAKDPLTFLNDFATFSGTLLKSSFSLSSSAGILGILKTDGTILAQAKYAATLGAEGDGNSLQRLISQTNDVSGLTSETFKPAAPTPGVVPTVLPVPLTAPVKLSAPKSGSNKRVGRSSGTSSLQSSSVNSHTTYGKGTIAPSAEANAPADGALFPSIDFSFFAPLVSLFSSVWFACFLSILAFSSFSLMLVQRRSFV